MYTLCKSCTFKSITSIFMNLVLKSFKNLLLDNAIFLFKSRQDIPVVVLGHIMSNCSSNNMDSRKETFAPFQSFILIIPRSK